MIIKTNKKNFIIHMNQITVIVQVRTEDVMGNHKKMVMSCSGVLAVFVVIINDLCVFLLSSLLTSPVTIQEVFPHQLLYHNLYDRSF